MFVKIVHNKTRSTKVLSADSVQVVPAIDADCNAIDIVCNGVSESIRLGNNQYTVYLLNEQGRTIDTYRL